MAQIETDCKNSKGIVAEIQEKETDCKNLDRILAKIRGKREKLQESMHIINRYKK